MNIKLSVDPEYIFIFLGIMYGIAFLVLVPPFQVPDEYEHYYKAYDVSEGNIIPDKLGNKAGIYVPKSVKIATDINYQKWMFYVKNKKKIDLKYLLNLPFKDDDKIFVDISKYAVVTYSPVAYMAPALSIAIGKTFNFSPLALMYLGRFANLLFYVFIIFLSIRITPIFKYGFLLIALMPLTLFQVASLSADSLTIALSFLTIAFFLNLSLCENKKRVDKKEIIVLFLIIIALSLVKLPYFLLIFLFLLIPSARFGGRKRMFLVFSFIFLSAILTIFIWDMAVKGLYMPVNMGVSVYDQLFYILPRPFEFIQICFNTLTNYLHDFPIIYIGNWAFGDDPLPEWIYSTNLIMLITIALFKNNTIKINLRQRYLLIAIFLLIASLLFFIEYITWTEVGRKIVYGMQGRYFIPILPLIFLFFHNTTKFNLKKLEFLIVAYIIFSLTAVSFIFIGRYYI